MINDKGVGRTVPAIRVLLKKTGDTVSPISCHLIVVIYNLPFTLCTVNSGNIVCSVCLVHCLVFSEHLAACVQCVVCGL